MVWLIPLLLATVRLRGGYSYSEGRVEVYYNGEWGTVCDNGWDDTDASVVCRQLRYGMTGRAVHNSHFGIGSGPVWLDNALCNGNESSLFNCGISNKDVENCSHAQDAGVICTGTTTNCLRGLVPDLHEKSCAFKSS